MKHIFILATLLFATGITKAQSWAMKDPISFKLKNGLTVIVAENMSNSKVFSNFNVETAIAENAVKPGSKELLTLMLHESSSKLANQISYSDKGANINALAADFDTSLQALSAVIQNSAFEQSALDASKAKLISSIEKADQYYPAYLTIQAIEAISLEDVQSLANQQFKPANAYLTIAGHISVADAKVSAKKAFGEWHANTERLISK